MQLEFSGLGEFAKACSNTDEILTCYGDAEAH